MKNKQTWILKDNTQQVYSQGRTVVVLKKKGRTVVRNILDILLSIHLKRNVQQKNKFL
jgi:hypothetical protein